MSSNRLIYDECFYKQSVDQSVGSLEYILNPLKYENKDKCRHEFGLVGGPDVSEIKGNKTDLESALKGLSNVMTNCSHKKHIPDKELVLEGNAGNTRRVINTTLNHLKSCQMLEFEPVPLPDYVPEKKQC
tara:strand:+ start:884 stop:1273 length:390 start_codon:yes stop_codon:yes gene_type:complete